MIFCRLDNFINYTFLQIKYFIQKGGVINMTLAMSFLFIIIYVIEKKIRKELVKN